MKKRAEIKNMLGLTQEEMAMVLGITKGQWSMYKSGQRDLPIESLQQFSTLLLGVQKEKTSKTAQDFIKQEQHKTNAQSHVDFSPGYLLILYAFRSQTTQSKQNQSERLGIKGM